VLRRVPSRIIRVLTCSMAKPKSKFRKKLSFLKRIKKWAAGLFASLAHGYIGEAIKGWQPWLSVILNWFTDKFRQPLTGERFTVLICDLAYDEDGRQKKHVIDAFRRRGLPYRELHRTLAPPSMAADSISADADLIKRGRKWLEQENADLLIFGETAIADRSLRLWFVGRQGQHDFSHPAFEVENAALTDEFHDVFDEWLVSAALANLPDLGDQRNARLVEVLRRSEKRLSELLDNRSDTRIERLRTKLLPALGNLRVRIGERAGENDMLLRAIEDFKRALESVERHAEPLDWAMTQNNLGNALTVLGERETGTGRLEEAVAAYREALEERTRDRVPLDWAATQNNLGNALTVLGGRETGTGRLEEAVVAYREALEECTRDRVPLDWAMTQSNLGSALTALGERESGTGRLEEAVAAYREALEEYTRDRVPLGWAITQNNLGNALTALGERETGTGRLEEAVVAYRGALEVFESGGADHYCQMAHQNLALAEALLAKRR